MYFQTGPYKDSSASARLEFASASQMNKAPGRIEASLLPYNGPVPEELATWKTPTLSRKRTCDKIGMSEKHAHIDCHDQTSRLPTVRNEHMPSVAAPAPVHHQRQHIHQGHDPMYGTSGFIRNERMPSVLHSAHHQRRHKQERTYDYSKIEEFARFNEYDPMNRTLTTVRNDHMPSALHPAHRQRQYNQEGHGQMNRTSTIVRNDHTPSALHPAHRQRQYNQEGHDQMNRTSAFIRNDHTPSVLHPVHRQRLSNQEGALYSQGGGPMINMDRHNSNNCMERSSYQSVSTSHYTHNQRGDNSIPGSNHSTLPEQADTQFHIQNSTNEPKPRKKGPLKTWPKAEKAPITEDLLPYVNLKNCELCSVDFSHPIIAKDHLTGKTHIRKLKKLGMEIPAICIKEGLTVTSDNVSEISKDLKTCMWPDWILALTSADCCNVCNKMLTTESVASDHYISKKHVKKCEQLQEMGQQRWLYEQHEAACDSIDQTSFKYFCELCEVLCSSKIQLDQHLVGAKHEQASKRNQVAVTRTQSKSNQEQAEKEYQEFLLNAAKLNGISTDNV